MTTKPSEILDVAIVGGGISGLYAGWRLLTGKTGDSHKLPGKKIVVYELSGRTGGRLLTWYPFLGEQWDLEQTTHFLVVAATLLDLKTARLLPAAEVEDEEDLALLEARDLLFARLLQYRAYKTVGAELARRMAEAGRSHPRVVALEEQFASLLPEVLLDVGAEGLAMLAAKALAPRHVDTISTTHIHAPAVSVREQADLLIERLRKSRTSTFRSLVSDAGDTVTVIARFLALLELFREGAVAFDQVQPLGELTIRWTGSEDGALDVHDEFDEADGQQNEETQ